ncbi:hypothetical protein CLCR_09276 [Cladophialophora carrionii]|uniref:Uncharacterized protein n=1 Tax=Cladophialophora carrionii TaxID=86049 RepID=A0A1C1CS68_9EURO|nr:hypothetical protein CLCR_09276 [Cladophialophora carrionii]
MWLQELSPHHGCLMLNVRIEELNLDLFLGIYVELIPCPRVHRQFFFYQFIETQSRESAMPITIQATQLAEYYPEPAGTYGLWADNLRNAFGGHGNPTATGRRLRGNQSTVVAYLLPNCPKNPGLC